VLDGAPAWRTPTLLLWSRADRCVAPRACAAFAAAVPARLLARRRFDGLAHELFNEPERGVVTGALLAWLQGSLAQASVAAR
jgi:alpha-beta hydrolase superfamily lysophospholipase